LIKKKVVDYWKPFSIVFLGGESMREIKLALALGLGIELLALTSLGFELWVIIAVMVLSYIALEILMRE